ncbi:CinA family nicotinamide mononucleotide deamidase-related protein [Halarsenatibacter silvermanii]|uniref:Putative competence-damage inducible protein n=1 Tax=Halarsenatibacter silvermanii TaxID=321763 RepID=A0A1G9LMM6_9FIRM|nr:CinA family nicotinamide mononucleotide deamidase-related protein [Halarsenatibacter silvermanii]SDL63103.1 competence/damage-inducible protein cinA [Halarsenatibacter silvermanii]
MNKFSIMTIGDEIVRGEISDDNSRILADKLHHHGFEIARIMSVGDGYEEIKSSLKFLREFSDFIVTTGGLGPTGDDITRKAVAAACSRELIFREDIAEEISAYFEDLPFEMTDNNKSQAYIPKGAELIANPQGTAPGFMFEHEGTHIISLPGITPEMKSMLEKVLTDNFEKHPAENIYLLKAAGIGEAELEDNLQAIIDESDFYYRFLPHGGVIEIKISAGGVNGENLREIQHSDIEEEIRAIRDELGDKIFAVNENISLAEAVKELAVDRGVQLALAESCTGGLISKRIVDVPGASRFYPGGVTSYSNRAKMKLLGVSGETLKEKGAVSEEAAVEMAEGALRVFDADMAASVTGIAGPEGGSKEKPVGLVYFAITDGDRSCCREWHFNGSRQEIRWYTSQHALNRFRLALLNGLSC